MKKYICLLGTLLFAFPAFSQETSFTVKVTYPDAESMTIYDSVNSYISYGPSVNAPFSHKFEVKKKGVGPFRGWYINFNPENVTKKGTPTGPKDPNFPLTYIFSNDGDLAWDSCGNSFGTTIGNTSYDIRETAKGVYFAFSQDCYDNAQKLYKIDFLAKFNYLSHLPGDFDRDGCVTGKDFMLFQQTIGTKVNIPGDGADSNKNGTIDSGDLTAWRTNMGKCSK